MGRFSKGTEIPLLNGGKAKIVGDDILGEGGQGIVYLVEYDGKKYALKWYTANKLKTNREFRKNLENNALCEPPSDSFIWPRYVTDQVNGSFGYLMDLIDTDKFESFSNIIRTYKIKNISKTKTEKIKISFPSIKILIKSAINLVNAFKKLHRKGLSFQDINDGGIYIDTNTGDVLICDCDNICPDRQSISNIAGKPGYRAPEIERRESLPNADSDKFSLAILLFRLFFLHHPLDGKKTVDLCFTDKVSNEYYKHPIFILDPIDKSNPPIQEVKRWSAFPIFLQEAFIKSFTDGIDDPSKRLVESEWFSVLVRTYSDVVRCECGCPESFISMHDLSDGTYHCPGCDVRRPLMDIGKIVVALTPDTEIYRCQITSKTDDFDTAVAKIVEHKTKPGIFGIKNLSTDTWITEKKDRIMPDKAMILYPGLNIDFGTEYKGKLREISD